MSPARHPSNWLDRFALAVSPSWGMHRIRNRAIAGIMARHYEAATPGRRTENWHRSGADANAAARPALAALRAHARDLVRNNAWARNALRIIGDNTVGWGLTAKASGTENKKLDAAWKLWSESTQCDADGRLNFYGLQKLAMRTIAESGEVLVRRRRRRLEDGLAIPLQLQVLEPDYLDTTRDLTVGPSGGPIIQGIEFDRLGRRSAYWLFDRHPGSNLIGSVQSNPVPAEDILHVYLVDRPGQARGVSWFSVAILNLKDFDDYEDASLMRQKIAACFAGFFTDINGEGSVPGEDDDRDPLVDTLEPGMLVPLKPGQDVTFANPPVCADDGFSGRQLHRIAAGLGVTYEDMTGDYSQVNFSSARMSRIRHWAHVTDWRWNMLIPQLGNGVWSWAMEAAMIAGLTSIIPAAEWSEPPMPMIEPDKEGLALTRMVRGGLMTPDDAVRAQGKDPATHWPAFAKNLETIRELGITLDCDAGKTSQAGQLQNPAGADKAGKPAGAAA